MSDFKPGLEDVVIGYSSVCFLDGIEGRLLYRGYDIAYLAEKTSFEDVVYLLLNGVLPSAEESETFRAEMAAQRTLPKSIIDLIRLIPIDTHPMDALRTAISFLGTTEEPVLNTSPDRIQRVIRGISASATIVAALNRVRQGLEIVEPRQDLSHAGNFLYMMTGKEPSSEHTKLMDVALILHADHESNASTFAARVTASTLSDYYSAIVTGIGTLKGPLHGGANEAVMHSLLEIQTIDNVIPYVDEKLEKKEKIMGFGHRVYKTYDPRGLILKKLSAQIGDQLGERKWFDMSVKMEEYVRDRKGLYCNVDFYSASVYYLMGLPIEMFTPIFFVSRVAGYTAHILEQWENNRIFRPRLEYNGPIHSTEITSK
ncbi:citrate synthase [Fodinisporobacter ferrooxydans]|uniref:Citrate synthase n=1 Tax=Fodinisporobacter ferrooxydans TaxID=2901836 RepID=A0ABY4CKQ5_9BACL|nr:citrate synthase [Alicyclobacillaceae bacterium MYW30-H2]